MSQPELQQDFFEDQEDAHDVVSSQVDAMLSTLGLTLNLRNYIWAAFTEEEIALLQANLHLQDRNATLGLILPLFLDREELQAMSETHATPATKLESNLDSINPRQYLQVRYYFGSLTYRYLPKLERILQQARRERVCGLGRGVEIQMQQSPYLFNYCRSLDDEYLQAKRQQQVQQLTLNNIRTQMQLEAAKHTLTQDVVHNMGGNRPTTKTYITKPYSPLEVENYEQVQVQIARASLKFLASQEPEVAQALQGIDVNHLSYARLFELLQTLQWSLPDTPQVKQLINQLLLTEKVTEGQKFDTWQLQQSIAHNANVVNFGGQFSGAELEQRVFAQDVANLSEQLRNQQQARQAWVEFGQEQQEVAEPIVAEIADSGWSGMNESPSAWTAYEVRATWVHDEVGRAVSDTTRVNTSNSQHLTLQQERTESNLGAAPVAEANPVDVNPLLPQANKLTLAQRARQSKITPSLAIQQGVNFVATDTNPFIVESAIGVTVTTAQSRAQILSQDSTSNWSTVALPQVDNLTWEQRLELGSRTIFVTSPEQIPPYYTSLLVLSLAGEDRSKLMRTPFTASNATFEYFSDAFGRKEDYSKFKGVLERQQQRITQELDFAKRVRRLHNQTLTGAEAEQLNRQVNDILVNYVYNQNTIPVNSKRVEILEKRLEGETSFADWDEENLPSNLPTYDELVEQLAQEYQDQPQDFLAVESEAEHETEQLSNAQLEQIAPEFLGKYFTQNLTTDARKLFEKSYHYVTQQLGRWQQLYQDQQLLRTNQFKALLQATLQQFTHENPAKWFRAETGYHATTPPTRVNTPSVDIVSVYSYAWQLGQLLGQLQVQAQQEAPAQLSSLQLALHCDAYLRKHALEINALSSWSGSRAAKVQAGVAEQDSVAQQAMLTTLSSKALPTQLTRVLFLFYIKHDLAGFLVALFLQQPETLHSYLGINQLAAQQLAQQDLLVLFHPQPPAEFLRWSGVGASEVSQGFTYDAGNAGDVILGQVNPQSNDKFAAARRAAGKRVTQQFTQAADQIINHLEQMLEVNNKLLGTSGAGTTNSTVQGSDVAQATSRASDNAERNVGTPTATQNHTTQGVAHTRHSTMLSQQQSSTQLTNSAFGAVDPHQESVFARTTQEALKLSAEAQLDAMIAMVEGKQEMPSQVRLALADYQQRLEARAVQVRQEYLHGPAVQVAPTSTVTEVTNGGSEESPTSRDGSLGAQGTESSDIKGRAANVAQPLAGTQSSAFHPHLQFVAPADLTSSLDRLLEGDYSQADFTSLEQERQAFASNTEKRRVEMFVSDSIEAFRAQIRTQVHEYVPEILNEFYATLDFKNLGKQVRIYLHQHDPQHKSLPFGFGSQGYLQHLEELAEHNLEQALLRKQELEAQAHASAQENIAVATDVNAEQDTLDEEQDILASSPEIAEALELGLISQTEYVESEHDYLSEPAYSGLHSGGVPQQQTRSVLSIVGQGKKNDSGVSSVSALSAVATSLPDLEKVFAHFSFEKMCLPAEQQFAIGGWAFDLKYLTCTYLYLELQQWHNLVEFYEAYKAHRKSLDKAAYDKFSAVLPLEAVVERIFALLQPYIDIDLLALHKVYTLEDYAQLAQKYQGRSSEVKQYRLSMQEQVAAGFTTLHKLARDWARPPRELKVLKNTARATEQKSPTTQDSSLQSEENDVEVKSPATSHAAGVASATPTPQKTKLQSQVAQAMQELQAAMQGVTANTNTSTSVVRNEEVQDSALVAHRAGEELVERHESEVKEANPNLVSLVNWDVDFDKLVPDFERQLQDEATKLHKFMTDEYQLPEIADYLDKASSNTALILNRLEAALESRTVSEIASQQAQLSQQLEQARSLLAQGMSMHQRHQALASVQQDASPASAQLMAQQQQVMAEKVYQLQQQIESLKAQLQELSQPREQVAEIVPTQDQQVWLDLGDEYAQQIQLNDLQHQEYHRRLQELRADLAELDVTNDFAQAADPQASERQAQRLMQHKLAELELFRVVNLDLSDPRLSKKLLQQLQREKEILAFAQTTNQDPRAMLFKSQENYLRDLATSKTRRQKGKIYETIYFGCENNPEGEYVYPVAKKVITQLLSEGLPCNLKETPWLQEADAPDAQASTEDVASSQANEQEQTAQLEHYLHEQGVVNSANQTDSHIAVVHSQANTLSKDVFAGRQELIEEHPMQVLPEKPQYNYSRIFKKARQALQDKGVATDFEAESVPNYAGGEAKAVNVQHLVAGIVDNSRDQGQALHDVGANIDSVRSSEAQATLPPPELEQFLRKLLGLNPEAQDARKTAELQEFHERQQQQLTQAEDQLDQMFASWDDDQEVAEQPMTSRVQERLAQMSPEQRAELVERAAHHVPRSVQQRFQEQQALRAQGLEVIDGRYYTVQDAIATALDALEAQEQAAQATTSKRKSSRARKTARNTN